jgi:5-methylcytosine-specific restriction endonuclease McrA
MRERISRVTNQRARRLLELIVEHGEVTTEELAEQYGYNHPPRAKKDAMDLGFPVVSRTVRSKDGTRNISAYSLDLDATFVDGRTGRRLIAKAFRDEPLKIADGRCAICGGAFPGRALQVDHRIPYEIVGEVDEPRVAHFQMLCASCNRSKSWTCERECPNWTERSAAVCAICIWASPEGYEHIATRQRRQVTLTWDGAAVEIFDSFQAAAHTKGLDIAAYLQRLLNES